MVRNTALVYDITPIAAPRMTRRDQWKKRRCVVSYFEFKDTVRALKLKIPESYHLHFILPMPKSWSKSKKESMNHTPHRQRPDKDNLEKALLDSLFHDDSHVWTGQVSKWWGYSGKIIIQENEIPKFPQI